MKKLISMLLVLTMVLGLGTIATAEDAPVEITFWHAMGGANGEAIAKMVEDFNALNAGKIKVTYEYQGSYDEAFTKIQAAGMSSMPCDIMQVYDIGTRFMIDSGWITPVQRFIDAEGYDISQIEENIAAYYTVDGSLYSMPFNSSTPLLYYNKTVFAAAGLDAQVAPKNFSEIYEMAEKLKVTTEDGSTRYGLGLGNYGWFFEQWVGKMGEHYVDQNNGRGEAYATKVMFGENGAGKDILTMWDKVITDGVSPYLNMGTSDSKAAFIAGDVCMILESTAALKSLLTNVGDDFEIGVGYFPSINADDEGGVSVGGGSLWAFDTDDQARMDATWTFIKYMIAPEQQAYWNAQTGYFPITVATHETEAFKANIAQYPQFQTAIDQLHDSAPRYSGALLSVFPEARQIVQDYTARLVNKETDVDATLEGMVKEINKAIENYNLVNY